MTPSLLDTTFVLLLVCVGFLRILCPVRHYAIFGLSATAVLLGLAAPFTLAVLAGFTLCVVYPAHILSRACDSHSLPKTWRRSVVPAAVVLLVGGLLLFKLTPYLDRRILGGEWAYAQVTGLFGFSYFIFRAIGFLHVQSIIRFQESTPVPLLYYTLFPTTLTSGPIQKYQDFRQQIAAPEPMTWSLAGRATYRITRGYFRKLVLAAGLNGLVESILGTEALNLWLVIALIVLLYLFFYFDFAGYSDIAIGFGLLLGIKVPENFRNPFRATTVAEFWRNWHITLVDWLRDQIFIPLGGMRASRKVAAGLAFGVMVLCGLWHGITWNFLAWGVWHGLLLWTEAMLGVKPIPPGARHGFKYWTRVLWTNGRVALGVLFFLPVESIAHLLSGVSRISW